MPLINCEINLILTWSSTCFITNSNGAGNFTITDTKLYVPVVTLSKQNIAELLHESKSGFKRTINWNKYQPKISIERQNQDIDYLIEPSFQGVKRLFFLLFEDNAHQTRHTEYFLSKVEIKDYNVEIVEENFFEKLYENIW